MELYTQGSAPTRHMGASHVGAGGHGMHRIANKQDAPPRPQFHGRSSYLMTSNSNWITLPRITNDR